MKEFTFTGDLCKTSLARAVAARMGTTQAEAAEMVHVVLDTVAKALASGYSVSVTNFGSWHPVVAPERPGRNPRTGETITIPERFRVKWTSGPKLVAMVNGIAESAIDKAPSK